MVKILLALWHVILYVVVDWSCIEPALAELYAALHTHAVTGQTVPSVATVTATVAPTAQRTAATTPTPAIAPVQTAPATPSVDSIPRPTKAQIVEALMTGANPMSRADAEAAADRVLSGLP